MCLSATAVDILPSLLLYISYNGDVIGLNLMVQSRLTMQSQSITTLRMKNEMRRKRDA